MRRSRLWLSGGVGLFLALASGGAARGAGLDVKVAPTGEASTWLTVQGVYVARSKLPLVVSATSAFQITAVHLQVETVSADVTGAAASQPITLDVSQLARGQKSLTVEVTDAQGTKGTTSFTFVKDAAPVVTLEAPADGAVIRDGKLMATATCVDDDPAGCVSLTLAYGARLAPQDLSLLGSGTSSASGTVTLTPTLSWGSLYVVAMGVDSAEKERHAANPFTFPSSTVTSPIYLDQTSSLEVVGSGVGQLQDFDAGRLLFVTTDHRVLLADRRSGALTTLGTSDAGRAVLTSTGVAFSGPRSGACAKLLVSKADGQPAQPFTDACVPPTVLLSSRAAYWTDLNSEIVFGLFDGSAPSTGQTWPVSPGPDACALGANAVLCAASVPDGAGTGSASTLFRFHDGATSTVATWAEAQSGTFTHLSVDGGTIAVARDQEIWAIQGSSATKLAAQGSTPFVSGNYVSFLSTGSGNTQQVFQRAGNGTAAQISAFASDVVIEGVNDRGEVAVKLDSSSRDIAGRYVVADGATSARLIPHTMGTFVSRCDGWYLMLGNTLLRLTGTTPRPATGCGNGGGAGGAGGSGAGGVGRQVAGLGGAGGVAGAAVSGGGGAGGAAGQPSPSAGDTEQGGRGGLLGQAGSGAGGAPATTGGGATAGAGATGGSPAVGGLALGGKGGGGAGTSGSSPGHTGGQVSGGGGGCSLGGDAAGLSPWAGVALALATLRRRARRR